SMDDGHWATILAPYLIGPAQTAYRNLDPQGALVYTKVKEAILDQTGVNPETYCQRLHRAQYPPGACPRAVAQQIKDDCWHLLEPDQWTGAQVAECIALEQFLQVLPVEGKEWVQRHRPSTLAEAISLMEDYTGEHPETMLGLWSGGTLL
uniref:SCAN box domain-containing protein n=1 Tax=Pelusios castaneus TaxID=367368 RepID=A0A8C8R6G8_9SAUR